MAKKKAKDVLPNRAYVVVSLPAATTTVATTTIQTQMSAVDKAGWLISRVDVQPRALLNAWQTVAGELHFQVAGGDQAAMLMADDPKQICTFGHVYHFLTSGAASWTYPFTWIGPVLHASREITCLIHGSDDSAPLQSVDFLFTIWFNWITMEDKEWIEMIQAKGLL